MSFNVTVKESIFIAAQPEVVWDYTQDYSQRSDWDDSILEAQVLQEEPEKHVRIRGKGGISFTAKYTLFRRPQRTSLSMVNVQSSWAMGGGGSWSYEAEHAGTRWTQTNTLSLKDTLSNQLLYPIFAWQLRSGARRAMRKAKQIIEQQRPAASR